MTAVTKEGLEGLRPGRDARPGTAGGARRRRSGTVGEPSVVEPVEFESYYGRAIVKEPVWKAREIAGYLFLGGLAGTSSLVAAAAHLSGRRDLARVAKVGAVGAGGLSLVALVTDLGRPGRFINMLRVFKPSSPMNIGSWILAGYVPAAGIAALTDLADGPLGLGACSTGAAAVLGAALSTYTGVLVADTAVPAWHDAHREMPFVFAASAACAAAGLGLLASEQALTALQRLAWCGAAGEALAGARLDRRLDPVVARPYRSGRSGRLVRGARGLGLLGAGLSLLGRSPAARRAAGVALLTSSAATRFGIFYAGIESARDPEATVASQRARGALDPDGPA